MLLKISFKYRYITFSVGKNYHCTISAFQKINKFKSNFSVFHFDFSIYPNKEDDHCPRLEFIIILIGFKIFEFEIAYNFHRG